MAVGDVNGDGIPDYVIGDPAAGANGRSGSGSVYVIYGQKGDKTTPRTVDLSQIPLQGRGPRRWGIGSMAGRRAIISACRSRSVISTPTGSVTSSSATPTRPRTAAPRPANVYVIYGQKGTSAPELDVSHMSASQGTIITGFSGGDLTGTSVAVGKFNAGSRQRGLPGRLSGGVDRDRRARRDPERTEPRRVRCM